MALGCASWVWSGDAGDAIRKKPNIVFILADDLGYRDLSCQGSRFYATPNIDRMAKEGLRFTCAHAAPVCTPTRAAIMTGKSPAKLHMTCVRLPGVPLETTLPASEYTIAELLRDNGYATALFGKWHLAKQSEGKPENQGFMKVVGANNRGTTPSHFAPYGLPGMEDSPAGEYLTDRLTSEACAFMAEHKDRPFFVYLSHYAVHTPLQAKPKLIAKYEKTSPDGEQNNATYAAMVESLDDSVGTMLRAIDELGLSQRTMVVFYSDNGGLDHYFNKVHVTSNLPLRGEKGMLYEGGVRVPMMVRWPGVTQAGTTCATPMGVEDWYPTLASAAEAAIPPDLRKQQNGVSVLPLLRGEAMQRPPIFWHYPHYHDRFPSDPAGAILDGDWKLIEFFQDGRTELYNLKDDIGEAKNLASIVPDRAKAMQAQLAAWRDKVGAQMPMPKNTKKKE